MTVHAVPSLEGCTAMFTNIQPATGEVFVLHVLPEVAHVTAGVSAERTELVGPVPNDILVKLHQLS